jgi:acid phosphatase (class A)
MRQNIASSSVAFLLAISAVWAHAQSASPNSTKAANDAAVHTSYLDRESLPLDLILSPPPAKNSPVALSELAELHRIEDKRTAEQVAQAQVDDHEETIFLYASVMGAQFNTDTLPLTSAFSKQIRKEESAASSGLKSTYHRARPYQADVTLHPVCATTQEPNSYPSGHSLSGYLLAFTLIQMVPEKHQQILDRADQYAHNRLVCGVHYASDTEASRRLAYAIFGSLAASPQFQKDLAAARAETRQRLGLPVTVNP